jgi:hypothetical protein
MKTWTSILAAGAILAFAAPAGNAARDNLVGNGVRSPYYYLGNTQEPTTGKQITKVNTSRSVQDAKHTAIAVGNGVRSPYYYLGNTQEPDVRRIGP